jgi:protein-arginine deiminase
VGGKRYPAGRIYYGTSTDPVDVIDPKLRDFLHKQTVQDPIELDTSWLTVGHVDEVVSFVPAPGGFRMLLASPRRAYEILDALAGRYGDASLLTGRRLPVEPTGDKELVEDKIRGFLTRQDDVHPYMRYLTKDMKKKGLTYPHTPGLLRDYNMDRQKDIDRMRDRLTSGLGITEADVIDIPAVFMPNPQTPHLADALVPGMVNMLVINGHCIVPKPFGPVIKGVDRFEQDVRYRLVPLGLTVHFLDCWNEYHVHLGEVHCATNALRVATPLRWWEFQP